MLKSAVLPEPVEGLITQHLDLWTAAIKRRSTAGRGSSSKIELYGIKKLRELILELAVRGLLVQQDPNEEPADKLLKCIQVEKAKLISEGRIKREKPLSPIAEEEKPFEVPLGWALSRLGVTGRYINGLAFKPGDWGSEGLPIIRIQNLSGRNTEFNYTTREVGEDVIVEPGEMLVSWSATLDVFIWKNESRGVLNQHIFRVAPSSLLNDRFLFWLLKHSIQRLADSDHAHGLVMSHINRGDFLGLPVVLPPLAEQHRIIAKVDELMALCDQLEQQTDASLSAHQTLVETLLNSLISAVDHAQFASSWQRIAEHFDTLFTTEASIAQLKQTILQLAVMGKLVPQDLNDEPASELLKKIAAEKAKLVKEGKIKKEKPLPPITDQEKPFDLPDRWSYSHLQEICLLITDGTHQTPTYTIEGRPFISAQCIKPFNFIPENCRYVSEDDYQEYVKNRKPERGDILLSRVGAGIGEAALIDQYLDFAIYVSTGLLKLPTAYFLSEYLVLWLNSPIGRHFSASRTLGKGVSQGNLNLSLIRAFVVSVPPFSEQHRIVAKVDELMALCDRLKSRLNDAQITQLHLADALTEKALARAG
jgi:type I restriction enzyme S subunit